MTKFKYAEFKKILEQPDNFFSIDPILPLWLKMDENPQKSLRSKSDAEIYVKIVENKLQALFLPCFHGKNTLLFFHNARLSFFEREPLLTFYEMQFDVKLEKEPTLTLFRLIDNRIDRVTSSSISTVIRDSINSKITFFYNTTAEISMNLTQLGKDLFVEVFDKSNHLIVDFSTYDSKKQKSQDLNQLARANNQRKQKAQENNYLWAYLIPHFIDQAVVKFWRHHHFDQSFIQKKGTFVELDLDPKSIRTHESGSIDFRQGNLIPAVDSHGSPRHPGLNQAGVVIGIKTDDLHLGTPLRRLLIIGDLTHTNGGTILSDECLRIAAAIRFAAKEKIPIEWFSASFGVKISQKTGVENLAASAAVAREIIQHAGQIQINILIDQPNVGAQAYWDALATILPNTQGILFMTSRGNMVLTGPRALTVAMQKNIHSLDVPELSKRLFPDGLATLGNYDHIYGPNGEAMGFCYDLSAAYQWLLLHYYYTYKTRGQKIVAKRKEVQEPIRDHTRLITELKKPQINRKAILEALNHTIELESLSWWKDLRGDTIGKEEFKNGSMPQEGSTLIQLMLIGSRPTLVIFPPSGPLTPCDSQIIGRAIYKAKGQLPVLLLLNLTGFNSDPLSMSHHQLSFGALIPQAIVENRGPITIVNIGYLIGGTFVVFSKELNPHLKIIALESSSVQVVGGVVASKVIFHKRLQNQASQDPRLAKKSGSKKEELLRKILLEYEETESNAYNRFHTAQRALEVDAIDEVVTAEELYETIIEVQESSIKSYEQESKQDSQSSERKSPSQSHVQNITTHSRLQ